MHNGKYEVQIMQILGTSQPLSTRYVLARMASLLTGSQSVSSTRIKVRDVIKAQKENNETFPANPFKCKGAPWIYPPQGLKT